MFQWALKRILGTNHERELKRLGPLVSRINALEAGIKKLDEAQLRAKTGEFKQRIENGAGLDELLPEAFAVCRESSVRALGMRHYDVQLIGGIALHEGKIAEMKTGEGKTLVATLACYLNALEGKGVHVVTVNDYLAQRDAEWMGRLYGYMGLSTGVVVPQQGDAAKKAAYRSDITYGQNNEFGFDYLRDNMKFSIYDYAQRELNFAIVDEVDSILVDEARTPLIISGPGETASEKYRAISDLIPRLRRDEHFVLDEKAQSVTLTEDGIVYAQKLLLENGISQVENLYEPANLQNLHILQQCLRAHSLYKRDQHYMVTADGKCAIIDEFTGRVLSGRRWSDGLHQAVEAKEHVRIQDESRTLATISFQNLFRLYNKLSGMTGTADTEASEFHKIYKLDVLVIPTNRPIQRADHEDLVYKSEKEKFHAVANEIVDCRDRGQPVLVGTTSVEKSDALSRLLTKQDIPHNVLNAKQHEREAFVVAQAGRRGAVTVATNMAGRGTDILLGGNPEMIARYEVTQAADEELLADTEALEAAIEESTDHYRVECEKEKREVLEAGGLHILGTERHESRRIDNQLRGRSGRQGDPGSSRFFLSLQDDLMRIFAGAKVEGLMDRLGMEEDIPIEHKWVSRAVENAQRKVEERNFDIRKHLLEYDDVMNQQRKSIYALRKQVIDGQYRTQPTEDERNRGVEARSLVPDVDQTLAAHARPILTDMLRVHGAEPPAEGSSPEEVEAYRQEVMARELSEVGTLKVPALEQDVYTWFGCRVPMKDHAAQPEAALSLLEERVGRSLSEQQERLLDLVDELVGTMVERACPPKKHFEDWDMAGMASAYREQFALDVGGAERLSDSQEIAERLYADAEGVLRRKEKEFTSTHFLRLFRTLYLQEIDRQWLEHLGHMDNLRDGIGLRGYGQRDPKKEYKREGYNLYVQTIQSVKASVVEKLFKVEHVTEEDVQAAEAQRRAQTEKRQAAIRATHVGEGGASEPPQGGGRSRAGGGQRLPARQMSRNSAAREAARLAQQRQGSPQPSGNGEPVAASRAERRRAQARGMSTEQVASRPQVRREGPKLKRNDQCWCGSGKKYKNCHMKNDQAEV